MSKAEEILIRAGKPDAEVAQTIADALHMELTRSDSGLFVGEPVGQDGQTEIGGMITKNYWADPSDGEESALNYFDVSWTLYSRGLTEEEQAAEARRIFDRLVTSTAWPLLLMSGADTLVAARNSRGVRHFEDSSGVWPESVDLWREWVPDTWVFGDPSVPEVEDGLNQP